MTTKPACAECGTENVGDLVFGLCAVCALKSAEQPGEPPEEETTSVVAGVRRFGDYTLGRQIGRGGMGVVYEASQDRPRRVVALKMILDSAVDSPEARGRFTIEAETAAGLDHPNIVAIYEVGELEGRPYLTMKRIAGENLRRKIASGELCLAKNAELSRAEQRQRAVAIAQLVATIARAVHHAHHHGVVHRDLKPANILVDDQGQPHLTDFGLAKRFGEGLNPAALALTGSGALLGTPGYMSPEQADARPVTPASDIFSLGAILYEMLTGEPPFRAGTLRETLRLVVEKEASAPSSRLRGIDLDLDTICLKCLEKNPDARYATAEALAGDLQCWIDGRPIGAHRVGYAGRTVRWVKRNRLGAGLIASLCLCLVVSLVLLEGRLRKMSQVKGERDWVRDRIAKHIDTSWGDASVLFIPIEPRDLAALGDRSIHAGVNAVNLTFGVSIPFDPLTQATKYSRFLGEVETRMTRALGRPVTFTLVLYKAAAWDIAMRQEADVQRVNYLTYIRWKESKLDNQALVEEIPSGDPDLDDGVVFARAGAGITNVAQLPGRKFVFAHTNSLTSTQAKLELARLNICAGMFQSCTNLGPPPRFLSFAEKESAVNIDLESFSHREVMAKVIGKEFDAGVATYQRFARMANRRPNLVVLHRFTKMPDIFVARSGLSGEIVAALRKSLLNIRDKELLGSTVPSMRNGFAPVNEAEFNEFKIRLEKYLPWFETCGSNAPSTNRNSTTPR